MNASFETKNRVKFDLFRRYGLIAAAGDRHLAEFMPGDEYLKDPDTVASWGFKLTTVDSRKERTLSKERGRNRVKAIWRRRGTVNKSIMRLRSHCK